MEQRFNINGIKIMGWNFFPFLLSILVFMAFKFGISENYKLIFFDAIENTIFGFILICISWFFRSAYYLKTLTYFLHFFVFVLFVETAYFYLFGVRISGSALFIFFETNRQETREFITSKFDVQVAVLLILYIVWSVILFIWSRPKKWAPVLKKKYNLLLVLFLVFFLKVSDLIVHNFPYSLAKSVIRYTLASLQSNQLSKHTSEGVLKNVKDLYPTDRQVHVILVGESTNRGHFSLYNQYDRSTTPRLNAMREEIIAYDDVISPHSSTAASLKKVLTRDNYENLFLEKNATIIQLLNESGYKTYWFSNQRPVGFWSTLVTKIAKGADSTKFFNSEDTSHSKQYDHVLVKSLKDLTSTMPEKAVIFLHMLGTHMDYKNRYPKDFDEFHQKVTGKNLVQSNYINQYDNAILYNDYIIAEVIDLAKSNNFASVLYFSDHGEEVHNTFDFHGHLADTDKDARLTKDIFEIPFILWASNGLLKRDDLSISTNRHYMIDDLFHSLAHLVGINADQVDVKRSIFSEKFERRKRIIGNEIDFDQKFE